MRRLFLALEAITSQQLVQRQERQLVQQQRLLQEQLQEQLRLLQEQQQELQLPSRRKRPE
ncbi:MAG TPA: hypothetical protein VGD24_05935 [Gallionella sp.]